jgi:YrbI family 3-deoxy-D-manno-octulosonate 8-phosphate phosphatase
MRFLEYGDPVACAPVAEASIGVDHPEDIARAEAMLAGKVPAPAGISAKLAAVRLLTLDVDGVQTDGSLYYTEAGDIMRRFNVRDGMGIKRLMAAGIAVAFVSQSATPAILARGKMLGVTRCLNGIDDKLTAVSKLCAELGLSLAEVAHMGDDVNDLPLFRAVGLAATVSDAAADIAAAAHWRSSRAGGQGAVREFCELLLAARSAAKMPD